MFVHFFLKYFHFPLWAKGGEGLVLVFLIYFNLRSWAKFWVWCGQKGEGLTGACFSHLVGCCASAYVERRCVTGVSFRYIVRLL